MADTNNNLNNVNNRNLNVYEVIQDYISDTNNDVNDDLLTSTLIESKYNDTESMITYIYVFDSYWL